MLVHLTNPAFPPFLLQAISSSSLSLQRSEEFNKNVFGSLPSGSFDGAVFNIERISRNRISVTH